MNAPLRLLIVEDSEDDALLIVRELQRAGREPIYERVDTEAAFRAAVESGSWDIVVSDFRMPQFTGTDALTLLRARDQDTPFIFVSGTIGEDVAVEAMRAGAQDYVTKGNLRRLVPAIERELRDAAVRREHRAGEARFHASEAQLRAILRAALDAHITMDEAGTITGWNPQAEAIFGWSEPDALGKVLSDVIIPPANREAHRRGMQRFLATGEGPILNKRLELTAVRRNGQEFAVELAVAPIRLSDRWIFSAFVRDITERKQNEKVQAAVYSMATAAQTAASLQDLLRSVHETTATLMPARNFYIALYDEATDLLSFPYFVDEVDPPPPPRRPTAGLTEHVLRSGQALLSREDFAPATGGAAELPWIGAPSVDWLGVPLRQGDRTLGVIAVQTYTTGVRYGEREKEILQFVATQIAGAIERQRAADALRRSEERHRLLFDAGPHPMWVYDFETLRFLTVNDAAVRDYGYTREEFLTMTIADIRPPEEVPALLQHVATLRGGAALRPGLWRHRKKDGAIIDVEVVPYTLTLDGRPAALVLAQDVTERNQLQHQLSQSQKMEAVGRLAGGIAHDFNNLLTAIFGYADLLAEDLPPGSPGQVDVKEIRNAATRASALTRQLLAFSRQQVLQPAVLNVIDVVGDLENMLQRVLGEDVELEAHLAADLGNIRVDQGQLEQVILNLAINARDAMPTGGKLTIETANVVLDEHYAQTHRPVVPGRYVMIAVSDTGMGMDAATQARIFEPFFTTKARGKGTGLGLATAYGIVKQSGGYIWVYSEVGRGATFKIYLPRVDEPTEAVAAPPELGSVSGTETVLLAEDDALLLPLARDVLKRLGYTVLEARTPADAVAVAQAYSGVIHVLVSDVVMPGESGLQLAHRLLEVRPNLRVLYMSGYSDEAVVRHGLLDPGTTFLQKPFTPAALARKVREVLDAPRPGAS
ncbi:MAG TPA: PAS domain S-box protein [Gemmatimonadales bacterium]|jgi:hypothetical protein|nr:PAS domain S-box protein [Gemmatimonadales bacterium]